MTKFEELLKEHKQNVTNRLSFIEKDIHNRAISHDMDKITDPVQYEAYSKHFVALKKIPFGSEEYYTFEKENFNDAHENHAQNRHHFYSKKNKGMDTNLLDLLEAIVDISESQKQYDNDDLNKTKEYFSKKGLYDLNIEKLIDNTLLYINDTDE
ncbi:MAG: DUF5662 family protein [Mycoplasmatales bacterium]